MITEEKKFVAEISECSDVIKMGIDIDSKVDMKSILEILGDSMYSNKPLTLLREYSTNAYDAHVEAGIGDKPIEIFLPSAFSPELKIRDYGFGLSRDGMQRFASYGKSSKRDSNDVVGHLGVGCKSAFSYTDTFTITSIHEGQKSLYSATKDATGYKIYCLNSEPSDEPSGIEISIYVNPKDVNLFINNAFQCFKHFNPCPDFKNNHYIKSSISDYHKSKLIDAGNWIVYNNANNEQGCISLVMGNIIYPVRLENIELDSKIAKFIDSWKSKTIVLFANIGDVSHASTRENLKYDEKTKQWLIDVFSRMPEEASKLSQKFMSDCTSYWDAKVLYHTLIASKLGNGLLDVEYNGHKLSSFNSSIVHFHPSKALKFNSYNSRWEQVNKIPANENTIVFYGKGDITYSSVMPRYHNYVHANSFNSYEQNIFIVFFRNPDTAQEFINSEEYEGCNMIDLADCPYVKPNRKKNITSLPLGSILELKTSNWNNSVNSDYWKVAENIPDDDIKYYLVISHYKPTQMILSMRELSSFGDDMRIISKSNSKLYGVKTSEVAKLDDTWVNVTTMLNDEFKELCNEEHTIHYLTHQCLWSNSEEYRILNEMKKFKSLMPDNHPLRIFIESTNDIHYNSYEFNKIRRYVNWTSTKDETLYNKQLSFALEMFKKYPLLNHVSICDDSINDIIEYTKSG
jgi:hypothetical protein